MQEVASGPVEALSPELTEVHTGVALCERLAQKDLIFPFMQSELTKLTQSLNFMHIPH